MKAVLAAMKRAGVLLLLSLWLAACSTTPPAVRESPVVTGKGTERPTHYTVQRGDTLYAIAFRYGLDYRKFAAANGIAAPYTIHPGQKLLLSDVSSKGGTIARTPDSTPAPATTTDKTPPPAAATRGGWQWPVPGKLLSRFDGASVGPKGIALAGNTGDPVRAARSGRVVYTGNSLVGYGQLVIIKHDDIYLSAYAHNSKLLVKEGQQIAAGQVIAEMGSSGTDRTQLHFEVRRNGDPIDPLQVLPSR